MFIRKRYWKILAIGIGVTLSSCMSMNKTSGSSNDGVISSEINSSSNNENESSASFSRDENGFKVFDKSYFDNTDDPNSTGIKSQVKFGDKIDDIETYKSFKLYVAGEEVPVYNIKVNEARNWEATAPNRSDSAIASVSLKGKAAFKLQCAFNPRDDVKIRPLGRDVPYTIDSSRWVISFTITTPGQYLIETRYRTLHLFVNELKDVPSDCITFKAGLHTKENDSRINSNNEITLYSGTKIYLEEGAIVRAKFKAYDASNISITGPGFIDGSTFERNVSKGIANVPLDISFCSNVTLEDFAITDPAGWAYNLYFSNNITINNTKIISSRSNGDGISVQSCKEVNVDSCFVRSWDDSLVVKNYVNWRNSQEGETSSIHFSNCLIYTDLAQSMEIGYETIGEKMEDITFDNMTVLHAYHKPIFSIHNGNNAKIRNVKYTNITVEDASIGKGDGSSNLFDFDVSYSPTWSDNHKVTGLGDVSGVNVENIKILSGIDNPKIKITGSMETRFSYPNIAHKVSNVTLKDVEIYGEKVTSQYEGLITSYAENINFLSEKTATGATYFKTDVSMYSNNIERVK